MRALLNIDYTNDFVAIDGALTCGLAGQALHDYIVKLTEEFAEAGDYVAFMIDSHNAHDVYHPETKLFPPHNIKGTDGRKLYGNLEELYQRIRTQENVEYFDKTRYSAFVGTNLELKLRERDIKELHLVGVCTDICILHTAIDTYNKGFDVVIHEKGVASFNAKGHEWAMGHFKDTLGFEIQS
ncbi:cysteine hydrolase family protein [Allofustis seminis]|uniref:cysteine hydrolase family protein n=1 Tax=Allofustis seminis TaxID=166939 RepID=UPI00037516E4|nr:isochorismatase family cysteine hydrolase [Allofustis seminis]